MQYVKKINQWVSHLKEFIQGVTYTNPMPVNSGVSKRRKGRFFFKITKKQMTNYIYNFVGLSGKVQLLFYIVYN